MEQTDRFCSGSLRAMIKLSLIAYLQVYECFDKLKQFAISLKSVRRSIIFLESEELAFNRSECQDQIDRLSYLEKNAKSILQFIAVSYLQASIGLSSDLQKLYPRSATAAE